MLLKMKRMKLSPHQIILGGFMILIFAGALLLALPVSSSTGQSIHVLDALFTSTSAVCVTGLVVLDTGTDFSVFGQVVIMLLIQVGGLGFMTYGVMIAIMLGKKIGLKSRMIVQESTKSMTGQGIVRLVLGILLIALVTEAAATIILTLRWYVKMGLTDAFYNALFHSISAFNNAGFALWSDSVSQYVGDPTVNIILSSLFIIGGLGFTVLLDLYNKKNWRQLSLHTKIVLITSVVLSIAGFVFIFLVELLNPDTFGSLTWGERIWAAYFQSVTPRTAGFNSIDIGNMMVASQFVIIVFMFIGASTGGTGGGIKTNTFVVLMMSVWSIIKGKQDAEIFKRRISNDVVLRALAVILISMAIILLVTLMLTLTEHGHHDDFLDFLFEATSAFGTVGLSLGLTPELSTAGKLVIIVAMFIGRLGPLTLAFALAQKSSRSQIRYAEEKVLIG